MAGEQTDPHDEKVRSTPLPTGNGEATVAQENMGPEVAKGGGEWPDPDAAPEDPAPGTDADAETGGPPPPRRSGAGTFPAFREVLEEDPVAGGAGSLPDGEEE